jgi:hypothetical protein
MHVYGVVHAASTNAATSAVRRGDCVAREQEFKSGSITVECEPHCDSARLLPMSQAECMQPSAQLI